MRRYPKPVRTRGGGRPAARRLAAAMGVAMTVVAAVGPVSAAASEVQVQEGGTATVEVPRTEYFFGAGIRLDYKYETGEGSAMENIDFRRVTGTLTFWPGVNTRKVEIETLEDHCIESDETFTLKVTDGKCTNYLRGDDQPCGLSVTAMSFEVTIKNVGGRDTTYEDTKYGCGGGSGGTIGE